MGRRGLESVSARVWDEQYHALRCNEALVLVATSRDHADVLPLVGIVSCESNVKCFERQSNESRMKGKEVGEGRD